MSELTITTASHFFKLTKITPRARVAVESFARKYIQFGFQRQGRQYIRAALKVFAMSNNDRDEYRFHINTLIAFEQHLAANYIKEDMITRFKLPIPIPTKVKFKIRPEWTDRDYQIPVINYLTDNGPPVSKFVDLQTGKGKSYVSMRAMEKIGFRTIIIVKPMYLEKWIADMNRTFDLEPEDILVIRGSSQLMAMLLLAEIGELHSKIILISNKTMQNWLKTYEKFMYESIGMGYACVPEDLCAFTGTGIVLVDEAHQDFHLGYKIKMVTNVYRSISLSATLLSDDDFMNKMYEIVYPAALRYKGPAYDKYVAATSVIYKLQFPNKMRCKDGVSKNYSHHLFEQSILRSNTLASNYMGLIKEVFEGSYLKNYKKGQRCLIFCISIELCTVLTDYLRKTYRHLDVRRYVEEDPFENILEADVTVSTMQSAGTAVDIENLTTVIMTTAMSSSQGNIQGLGRLRVLKDGTTPEFLYFVCEDINSHIKYHEKKRLILENRALRYRSVFINKPI